MQASKVIDVTHIIHFSTDHDTQSTLSSVVLKIKTLILNFIPTHAHHVQYLFA